MTYVPVNDANRKGHGRTPLDIPAALLNQLQHSRATGARCQLRIGPDDEAELAELKRQIVRAGYRHFPDNTIHRRRTGDTFTYWVGPKTRRGKADVQN